MKRAPDGANEKDVTSLTCGVSGLSAVESKITYSIFKHLASCSVQHF